MVQIYQKSREPSFGQKFSSAVGAGLEGIQEMKESSEFQNKFGFNVPKSERSGFYQALAKEKKDQGIAKEQTLMSLQQTIAQLKGMAESDVPGIGRLGQWSQSAEALQNRGQFQTLSSELFSYYKTLFPRGITQEEFKRIQKDYIPKAGEATNEMIGKLNGFMDLIERKLKESGSNEANEESQLGASTNEKFIKMRDPSGALRKVSSKDVNEAKKAGYKAEK